MRCEMFSTLRYSTQWGGGQASGTPLYLRSVFSKWHDLELLEELRECDWSIPLSLGSCPCSQLEQRLLSVYPFSGRWPPLKALHLVLFSDKLAIGPCIIDQRGLHLPRKGIAAKIAAMPGYEGGELEPFADKLGPAHASKPSMGHAATVPSPQM